ncbi:hypothetical protein ACQKFA_23440 [Streptomyces sp. CH6]|uniref:hypothetical protein n=1 Tax=Streptomyces sp. CH6 TaxID=3420320 RepID=UPI003CFF86A3
MTLAHSTATAGGNPGRPARAVIGALVIDMVGVRAKYECLRCRTVEGPVYGTDAVTAFVADIRTAHLARCTGPREPRP